MTKKLLLLSILFACSNTIFAEECPEINLVHDAVENHQKNLGGYTIFYEEHLHDINTFKGASFYAPNQSMECYYTDGKSKTPIRLYQEFIQKIKLEGKQWEIWGPGIYSCAYQAKSECRWTVGNVE